MSQAQTVVLRLACLAVVERDQLTDPASLEPNISTSWSEALEEESHDLLYQPGLLTSTCGSGATREKRTETSFSAFRWVPPLLGIQEDWQRLTIKCTLDSGSRTPQFFESTVTLYLDGPQSLLQRFKILKKRGPVR